METAIFETVLSLSRKTNKDRFNQMFFMLKKIITCIRGGGGCFRLHPQSISTVTGSPISISLDSEFCSSLRISAEI